MAQRDASPVYYREIQKHAYLKRMPEDSGSKLRPLVMKKPLLKPMWTQLCIHNGRTPYLEQYKDPVSARAHRPMWRASLVTARHVTASVTRDTECDFLIDTQEGPVRMLAPNWESMQEWVTTLRNKLRELRIVSGCENEYASPPVRARPRAAARDPASPLPTPPAPPDRVPGIDLSSVIRIPSIPETPPDSIIELPPETTPPETTPPETTLPDTTLPELEQVDISDWDDRSLPSTSQAPSSVANICGQNICLDGSLLKRGEESDSEVTDPDAGDQESDTANVTVIAVTTKDNDESTISGPRLIQVGAEETYGAVFEPAYEHLSRACSAVRLRVHDATYEYLFPQGNERSEGNVSNEVPTSEANREPVASEGSTVERLDTKPAWRRGLTELALLGRRKRSETTTQDNNHSERVTSRTRETRPDIRRRRSSSLSNGVPVPTPAPAPIICERIMNEPTLQPLRARQAAALVRAQRRGAACVARISAGEPPLFVDYDNQVWIARWGANGALFGGRLGDRLCAIAGVAPVHSAHAQRLIATRPVDILFYRVPLAKIFVINKRDQQPLGITLDKDCNIQRVLSRSPAEVGGIPPAGQWAVTEVNNRPLNLLKGGADQMNRISLNGTETSLLLQPSPLVKRLRAALKASK